MTMNFEHEYNKVRRALRRNVDDFRSSRLSPTQRRKLASRLASQRDELTLLSGYGSVAEGVARLQDMKTWWYVLVGDTIQRVDPASGTVIN